MTEIAARGLEWFDDFAPPVDFPAEFLRDMLATARRVVVLDDDPTGTQTVHGVPVLTRWQEEDIAWAFEQGGAGFFILTNTRSLSASLATERNYEIATRCLEIAERLGIELAFASRSDSTLRGHFPLETDVLAQVSAAHGQPIDGVVLSPAYLDAGRVTVDGIHWVRSSEGLTPVSSGEYARDATFGYRSSRLSEWAEEKSGGRIRADSVVNVGLNDIRSANAPLADSLRASSEGQLVVIDAVVDDDLRAATTSVLEAERAGVRLLYRVGPSFVRARLGQDARPPISDDELRRIVGARMGHGLIVVGSHVGTTSRQLARLAESRELTLIELDVSQVVDGNAEARLDEIASEAASELQVRPVVIHTSRALVTAETAEASLDISRRVSAALTESVRRTVQLHTPRFVVAKGGITSSDIATTALEIDRAWVRGSLLPGIVSLWQAASGPSEGLAYVVFAGNVGNDDSLAQVVDRLELV
jgi:uncharacterized protein YgbK (DUF1537 family)